MKKLLFIITLATFGVTTMQTASFAQSGRACLTKPFAVTGGSSRRESRALVKAVRKWQRTSARRYGISYRDWEKARNHRKDCKRIGGQRICTVSATPCRK